MRKSALKTIYEDMHSFGIQLFIHTIGKFPKIITNENVGAKHGQHQNLVADGS